MPKWVRLLAKRLGCGSDERGICPDRAPNETECGPDHGHFPPFRSNNPLADSIFADLVKSSNECGRLRQENRTLRAEIDAMKLSARSHETTVIATCNDCGLRTSVTLTCGEAWSDVGVTPCPGCCGRSYLVDIPVARAIS